MTAAQAFADALDEQEAIISTQRVPGRATDALGRPVDEQGRIVTECCGALDLGDSYHGGRPFQCVHQYERLMAGQQDMGL